MIVSLQILKKIVPCNKQLKNFEIRVVRKREIRNQTRGNRTHKDWKMTEIQSINFQQALTDINACQEQEKQYLSCGTFHIGDQRRIRRACASALFAVRRQRDRPNCLFVCLC